MKFNYKRVISELLMLYGLVAVGLLLHCRATDSQEFTQQSCQSSVEHIDSEQEYRERPHDVRCICKSLQIKT